MGNITTHPAEYVRGAGWYLVETAWGWCGLRRSGNAICRCSLPSPDRETASRTVAVGPAEALHDALLERAADQLVRYFEGEAVAFDLPVAPDGMTDFGLRVRRACAEIPWGETRGYAEIAEAAGSPGAARAVGQVLARNPVPIIVPCHRVIGADGGLVGFASGLAMKRRLLELERVSIVT